jgi:hypothetical protein
MPRTFDIRFARATGFAAILEAPANTFRWRGTASLSIDERGLEIEPRRGLHSLFSRQSRFRINTADLREVSRAADALRIEFGMPGARRAVVPVWARDSEAAAEIMRLVPTRRTIETDEPIAGEISDPRRNRMLLAALAFAMVGVAAWYAMRRDSPVVSTVTPETSEAFAPVAPAGDVAPSPDALPQAASALPSTNPVVDAAPAPVPVRHAETVEPPSEVAPVADVQPEAAPQPAVALPPADSRTAVFVPTDPLYDAASRQLDKFQALAAHTYVGYLDGSVPLAELAASWGEYSQAVVTGPDYHEPRLRPMIDEELAAAASWSRALIAVGEARSSRDAARISAARADLERVSDLTTRIALHVERH